MKQNYAQVHFSDEQWTQVDKAIDALFVALNPMLVALSTQQRSRAVKMGDGSQAFCRKAVEVIQESPQLIPGNFDTAELVRDLKTHDILNQRLVRVTRLQEKMANTEMALGSDVMVAALEGYHYLKLAGKHEGLDALRKLLGKRFEANGREVEAPQSKA